MQLPVFLVVPTPHAQPLMQVIGVTSGIQYPGSWDWNSCRSIVALWPLDRDPGFSLGTNGSTPEHSVLRDS